MSETSRPTSRLVCVIRPTRRAGVWVVSVATLLTLAGCARRSDPAPVAVASPPAAPVVADEPTAAPPAKAPRTQASTPAVQTPPSTAPATEPALTAEQRELNLASFDMVWETIRDRHFDPTYNGVDWNAVRETYRPRVEAAATMDDAREAMNEAISELKQSHFGVIPSNVYADMTPRDGADSIDEPATQPGREGTFGIEPAVIDGQLVVRRVAPGSPADQAGIRPGWIVTSVNDKPVAGAFQRIGEAFEGKPLRAEALHRAAEAALGRRVGTTVPVELLNAQDAPVRVELTAVPKSERMAGFGNLPPMPLRLESRRLTGDVGYIHLSLWMDPGYVIPEIRKAIDGFADTRGIIIDVRGNPGGIGVMAMGVGNYFVTDNQHKLGTMITRDNRLNFVLQPQPTAYTRPLAILIDERSMSTSEIFAGGMKDIGRARIIGTPTPGAALPSIVSRLPNGDGFQYAFANYVSAGGQVLEGDGVPPDQVVALDRASLLAGSDPVIDAAVQWIASQSNNDSN
jgi:carboxyl-terminal processing protease